MKKLFLFQFPFAMILVIFSTQVLAQRMYVSAEAGYGLGIASGPMGYDENYTNTITVIDSWNGVTTSRVQQNTSSIIHKSIKGSCSYGKGFQTGATFGYMFTENIGAELGVSYLFGAPYSIRYTNINQRIDKYIDLTNNANNTTASASSSGIQDVRFSGNMLRLIPAIRITAGNGKIKPFMRIGLVIGLGGKIKSVSKITLTNTTGITETLDMVLKRSGGVSLGVACGLGADIKLSEKFGIFAEAGVITQTWAPKKAVLTKANIDGVDQFPTMTTYERESEYYDSYTQTYPSSDTSIPHQESKVRHPFSSIGINVGVRFSFGKKINNKD